MSKTHVIDGVTYVEVERRANVGEKIIDKIDGEIATVLGIMGYPSGKGRHGVEIRKNGEWVPDSEYHVLEPLKETPDITDILANLANRVHSLEQQLRDAQRNLETFAEQTESNMKDIAFLDERTETQSVEVVTFEKFLDSIADKVAERLVGGR
jgi:hypothetical protein